MIRLLSISQCCVSCLLLTGSITAADDARVEKDIEFANVAGHSLKLDLYMPIQQKPPHLVVWIHGGGWQGGSKDNCPVSWLTDHGFAVASISYRLTDKAIFPAQIHDCKAAVRWLRANARKYGYRHEKMAVAGSSAGGHLAALMGTSGDVTELEGTVGGNLDHSSRVDAVIDFYGATDFILRSKTQPHRANKKGSVVYRLLGGGADTEVELAKLASAAHHVTSDDPPILVFHGDEDNTVLLDQSQRLHEVYTRAGLPISLHVLEGVGHGGRRFYEGRNRELIINFLEQVSRATASTANGTCHSTAFERHRPYSESGT
jgi:acetyl esterase/lipase